MGNSGGKRKNYNSLTENSQEIQVLYTHAHKYIHFAFFSSGAILSVRPLTPIHRLHTWTERHWICFFSCLLLLTPRKNHCRYETAKVTNTIRRLHSCDVLSFFFISFSYSQIHKIQQLVVRHQVISANSSTVTFSPPCLLGK